MCDARVERGAEERWRSKDAWAARGSVDGQALGTQAVQPFSIKVVPKRQKESRVVISLLMLHKSE